jgi:hypothetical protein
MIGTAIGCLPSTRHMFSAKQKKSEKSKGKDES